MNALENKIPPPLIALVIAAAMWGIARVAPSMLAVPYAPIAAAVVAVIGISFDIAGVLSFHRAKTTVNPLRPNKATSLVSSGVYRITRNPMYVGMLFLLAAWAIFLSTVWAFVGPVAFVLYMNQFQIAPEERALEILFGDDFAEYKQRVRRWL